MSFIETIQNRARNDVKTIVLPESEDDRTILAAAKVLADGTAAPIIIGTEEEVMGSAARLGADLTGVQILDHTKSAEIDKYAALLAEIRAKKGMTFEKAKELISGDKLTFGIMMVKSGDADGLVSGACHTSADMLRPALQIIKTAPERKIASIAFMFELPDKSIGEDGIILCADCALMQDPTPEELAEIGAESAASFEALIGKKAKVAFLCHSTKGSANHPFVDKVVEAVKIAKEKYPDVLLDGELQLDAAIIPEIGASKAPGSPVAGRANVLVFPDLQAGNIGYKITQRLGGADCFAVLQGLAKPCNDLSRGCSAEDIVNTVAMTAVQAQG